MIDLAQTDCLLKRLLTWSLWRPLRSTLRVNYLFHIIVLIILLQEIPNLHASTNILICILVFSAFTITSYLIAIILTLVFELPLLGLSSRLINLFLIV